LGRIQAGELKFYFLPNNLVRQSYQQMTKVDQPGQAGFEQVLLQIGGYFAQHMDRDKLPLF